METVTSWMFGQKLDDYNPEELTAEIFHAEANLLLSFLTFLQVSQSVPIFWVFTNYLKVTLQHIIITGKPSWSTSVDSMYSTWLLLLVGLAEAQVLTRAHYYFW